MMSGELNTSLFALASSIDECGRRWTITDTRTGQADMRSLSPAGQCCLSGVTIAARPSSTRSHTRVMLSIALPAGPGRGLLRVIVPGMGRCVMIGARVQRERWEALGGDCRMAGRQLSAGGHV